MTSISAITPPSLRAPAAAPHLSLISHPREITDLILQAAGYAE
jgi:hypothetical protein